MLTEPETRRVSLTTAAPYFALVSLTISVMEL
jgi:hypothetical protein